MKFADFSRLLLVVIVFNYANPEATSDDVVASSATTSLSSPKGAFTVLASTTAQITSPSTTTATTTTTTASMTIPLTTSPTTTLTTTALTTTTPTTTPTTTTTTLPSTIPSTTKASTTITTTTTRATTPSPTPPPTTTSSTSVPTESDVEADLPIEVDEREKINGKKVKQLEQENERLKIAVGVLAAIIIVTVLFVLLIIYLRKRNSVELRSSEKPNRPIYFRPVSNFKKTPPIDPALEYLHDDRLFVNDLDKEMETFRLNRGTNQMTSEL